jgi:hypothetical protein
MEAISVVDISSIGEHNSFLYLFLSNNYEDIYCTSHAMHTQTFHFISRVRPTPTSQGKKGHR